MLTPLQFVTYVDKVTAAANAESAGATNAVAKAVDLLGVVMGFEDWSTESISAPIVDAMQVSLSPAVRLKTEFNSALGALAAMCKASGNSVSNIDTFCTYWNAVHSGAGNQAPLPPDFRTLHYDVFGVYPSAGNVYSPAITTVATKIVGSTFTAGTAVDTTKYAGGVPHLVVTNLTGSDVVTATGTNQYAVTGHTWTVTPTMNGEYSLLPGTTGDLLVSVQSIGVGGSLTVGTLVVKIVVPDLVANLGTFTHGGAFVVGTPVPGGAGSVINPNPIIVDPQLKTVGIVGSGVVTVTGVNQNGVAGELWTATPTADGYSTLVPTTGGDELISVSNISPAGGITGGVFTVVARRLNPPA